MPGNDLDTAIARFVWETRYRRASVDGVPEPDIGATWRRVARALAACEPRRADRWGARFLDALVGFRFLPAGRILAGAGTGLRVTLFNCFVMGLIDDDMEGIFEALKEGALTLQAGGGVGYDFSTLRPSGSIARTTGRTASGPVPFLDAWDAMCGAVLATGARRGAMIATLRCDHPDIEAFIDAKREPGRLQRFNLSVQVSDEFMRAVEEGQDWPLVFPAEALAGGGETVRRRWPGRTGPVDCRVLAQRPARALWERLVRACYESGEPGVLFVDTINRGNNLAYREYISTTNPCGEVPLPPYGACNLGSINLVRFVRNAFAANATLDLEAIAAIVPVAVRLLDDVIECSCFPLPRQAAEARGARRVGLGITGLADALIMLGLHYDSPEARAVGADVMRVICEAAYRASVELAREKGAFPYFERAAFLRSPFVQRLPADITEGIARHGIRNGQLLAIAPTGTISLLAGNVSSGIEPVFDYRMERCVRGPDGAPRCFEVSDHAWRAWQSERGETTALPTAFVRAQELPAAAHLRMQAALQHHVDGAISKTVNVPADLPLDAFQAIYRTAHELGLKGCTTFRPAPGRETVLGGSKSVPGVHCCSPEREGD